MGSTVLVFLPLMLLWAAILVPMWLRNHDAAVESKSVDRFSTAMSTLSRRGPRTQHASRNQAGSRDLLVPARSRAVVLSGGRAPSVAARRERAAKLARMRRRRSAVIALLGFFLVVALAAVIGAAPLWLPLVVLVGTGGFVWNLRAKAVREARAERRRRRNERPTVAAGRPATRELAPRAPRAPQWPVTAERQTAIPAAFTETVVVAEIDNGWAPTPIVLPTYATAPPATSIPRVIDLTHPGSWSAAHMLDAMAAGQAPDPDEIFDGRAEGVAPSVTADVADAELFDQYEVEHEAVAATVAGSTAQPFLDDDAVFDQSDDDEFLEFLDRRASGS